MELLDRDTRQYIYQFLDYASLQNLIKTCSLFEVELENSAALKNAQTKASKTKLTNTQSQRKRSNFHFPLLLFGGQVRDSDFNQDKALVPTIGGEGPRII